MQEIKIGQELYYRGLNWGCKEKCWKIEIIDGEKYVRTSSGILRKEIAVINNTCDLYSSKDAINETLMDVYKAKFID